MKDSFSTILKSALHFFSGTMISRVSGLARDIAFAFAFGTAPSAAAFLLSFRLAHLFRRVLGEGCLQQAFIPIFEKLRTDKGEESALSFYKLVQKRLLQGLIPLLFLSSSLLWMFESEISFLTLLMLPSLLFITLFGLNASLLQADRSFFLPAVSPVIFNLFWTGGALAFQFMPPEKAMPFMALALNLGCLAQWGLTLPFVKKSPSRSTDSPLPFKILVSSVGLGLLGVSANQINNAIDSLFALYADAEGPAYLWFAIRIEQFPLSLFSIAISSALLPPLARAVARGDLTLSARFFELALRKATGLLLPLTGYILLTSPLLISLLFGWGKFGALSVAKTATCLSAYAFALVPSTWVILLANLHFSFGNFKRTAYASLMTLGVNLLLNPLFLFGFGMGVESVALATAIASLANALFLLKDIPFPLPPFAPLARVGLTSLLAFFSTHLIPRVQGPIIYELLVIGFVYFSFILLFGRLLRASDLVFWKNVPEPQQIS